MKLRFGFWLRLMMAKSDGFLLIGCITEVETGTELAWWPN
jgi:hypothetical protein